MNPEPTSASPTGEELTERLELMQRQLEEVRAQLTESQRLATIGTISAVIAHEFNNLLTPIMNYSQIALKSAEGVKPDMDFVKKALSRSASAAERAAKICQSMLGLARGHSVFGKVDVRNLVEETLSVMAREPAKDGIALRVQVRRELSVVGDMVQLEQLLLNLLINARQAMLGRGGSLTIRAMEGETAGEVKIQVIDSGPGIPAKILPRIFERFFTTKGTSRRGEARGTGLGLSICKEIVELHHGSIEVSSELGKGTTFSIRLPAAECANAGVENDMKAEEGI